MQIHELDASTSPGTGAYLAVDNGTTTRKSTIANIKSAMFPSGVVTDVQVDGSSIVSNSVANINTTWTKYTGISYPKTPSSIPSSTWTTAVSSATVLANAKEVMLEFASSSTGAMAQILLVNTDGGTKTSYYIFLTDSTTTAALSSSYATYLQAQVDFSTGQVQVRQTMRKTSGATLSLYGIYYR